MLVKWSGRQFKTVNNPNFSKIHSLTKMAERPVPVSALILTTGPESSKTSWNALCGWQNFRHILITYQNIKHTIMWLLVQKLELRQTAWVSNTNTTPIGLVARPLAPNVRAMTPYCFTHIYTLKFKHYSNYTLFNLSFYFRFQFVWNFFNIKSYQFLKQHQKLVSKAWLCLLASNLKLTHWQW